jgi:hypothetical protein
MCLASTNSQGVMLLGKRKEVGGVIVGELISFSVIYVGCSWFILKITNTVVPDFYKSHYIAMNVWSHVLS